MYQPLEELEQEIASTTKASSPAAAGPSFGQAATGTVHTDLARLDTGVRATMLRQLQQGPGNAYVNRLLARSAAPTPCACGGGTTCRCHERDLSHGEHGLDRQVAEGERDEEQWEPPPWSPLEGEGEPRDPVHEAKTVQIKGLTHGNFDGGKYSTKSTVSKGQDCEGCKPKDCTTVSGTVESTFTANPKVELPKVSDFPDLTPCQQKRVQEAIDTKIAPHEQEHVTRFKTYDGQTSLPFSVTACRSELREKAGAVVDKIHKDENKRRGDAADKHSLAIDPFVVTVDLDCKEPEKKSAEAEAGEPAEAPA
jgi:hypothetical protein